MAWLNVPFATTSESLRVWQQRSLHTKLSYRPKKKTLLARVVIVFHATLGFSLSPTLSRFPEYSQVVNPCLLGCLIILVDVKWTAHQHKWFSVWLIHTCTANGHIYWNKCIPHTSHKSACPDIKRRRNVTTLHEPKEAALFLSSWHIWSIRSSWTRPAICHPVSQIRQETCCYTYSHCAPS